MADRLNELFVKLSVIPNGSVEKQCLTVVRVVTIRKYSTGVTWIFMLCSVLVVNMV